MTTLARAFCFVAFVSLLLPDLTLAGDNPRSIRATRTSEAPKIDGYLTDDVWLDVEPAKDFLQQNPDEGKPASEPTEIYVLYDDEAIYFGLRAIEEEYELQMDFEDKPGLSEEHKRLIAISEMNEKISNRKNMLRELSPIFRDMGPEAFEEWAEPLGIDVEDFYLQYEEDI